MKRSLVFALLLSAVAWGSNHEYLVKLKSSPEEFVAQNGGKIRLVSQEGRLYHWDAPVAVHVSRFRSRGVEFIEKNRTIRLIENPSIVSQRAKIEALYRAGLLPQDRGPAYPDNPEIKMTASQSAGVDPMLGKAWGMTLIGANKAWTKANQGEEVVVAVTDTGVDYNHEDLINNMWHNPKEIAGDGIDNDGNGFIDDIVGWDFAANDNKPYDLSLQLMDILMKGGNPGHGTHVAGVIGARLNNALGTAGVAPRVKIMAMRFITEEGKGDSEGAIKAIDYAVANGAKIINASWGSEGEEQGDAALRESIQRAEAKGVLFVAACGNGRTDQATMQNGGFNNDTDAKPMYPSSYPYENIVAVAAINSDLALASFSNFGKKTVDIAAPGVKIISTVPGSKYQDTIIDFGSMKVTWDGTSMAAPFVAGSLAVLASREPSASWKELKEKLLSHTVAVSAVEGKVATDGRVDLNSLIE